MKLPLVISFLSAGLLVGCSATLKPKITATLPAAPPPAHFDVNGQGFSQISSCATVSLLGMPSGPPIVHMKDASCTNGTFKFDWDYTYVAGCTPGGSQQVFVLAVDNPTLDPAIASVSIAWGPKCAFAGTCGKIGQPPCPSGCLEGSDLTGTLCSCGVQGEVACTSGERCQSGLTTVQEGSNSLCEPCGGNGQPICLSGSKCQSHLTPDQGVCVPCGGQGHAACTSGDKCQSGLTPIQQGSNSICQPCGNEQQPLCASGSTCQSGLHPQLEGAGNLVCEAGCGYGQGIVCTPEMVAAGMGICAGSPAVVELPQMPCITESHNQSVYTCYDSTISYNCVCQQSGSCKQSTSTGSCSVPGVCTK
jgi:hypothetical protein